MIMNSKKYGAKNFLLGLLSHNIIYSHVTHVIKLIDIVALVDFAGNHSY